MANRWTACGSSSLPWITGCASEGARRRSGNPLHSRASRTYARSSTSLPPSSPVTGTSSLVAVTLLALFLALYRILLPSPKLLTPPIRKHTHTCMQERAIAA